MTQRSLRSVLAGRGFMLVPAAAYAVHEGRYQLGYGAQASAALAAQGHGYLDSLGPWIAVLLALAAGTYLARLARTAAGRGAARPERDLLRLWGVSWVLLVAVYAVQEWIEGVFTVGHPAGLTGIFGHGGWWAIVLAGGVALAVAALLRAGAALTRAVSPALPGVRPVGPSLRSRPVTPQLPGRGPLTGAGAGRAPPLGCAPLSLGC